MSFQSHVVSLSLFNFQVRKNMGQANGRDDGGMIELALDDVAPVLVAAQLNVQAGSVDDVFAQHFATTARHQQEKER